MKIILSLVALIMLFTSCKKSQTKPVQVSHGTISATVDGVNHSFNTTANTDIEMIGGEYSLYVGGDGDGGLMDFSVDSATLIAAGNYTNAGLMQYSPVNQSLTSGIYENNDGPSSAIVTITSASTTHVEGTFSGVLFDYYLNKTVTVTDGVFSIDKDSNSL